MPMVTRHQYRSPQREVQKKDNAETPRPHSMVGNGRGGALIAFAAATNAGAGNYGGG
jgi:hypothetical protein